MDNYNVLFGKKIKTIRKAKGLTQEKLAELVNRSKNHISKIEQGLANPPLSLIIDIAIALNVTPYSLFEFDIEHSGREKPVDIKNEFEKITDKKHLNILFNIHKILLKETL